MVLPQRGVEFKVRVICSIAITRTWRFPSWADWSDGSLLLLVGDISLEQVYFLPTSIPLGRWLRSNERRWKRVWRRTTLSGLGKNLREPMQRCMTWGGIDTVLRYCWIVLLFPQYTGRTILPIWLGLWDIIQESGKFSYHAVGSLILLVTSLFLPSRIITCFRYWRIVKC